MAGVDERAALRAQIAELEQSLDRRTREMVALHEISLEINRQPSLAALLQVIVEKAASLLNAHLGGLYLVDAARETLDLVVGYNLPADLVGIKLKYGEGVSGRVAQTGQLLTVPDYQAWEGRARVYDGIPFRRVIGVPLKKGEAIIGVINISDDQRTGWFTDDEIRLVTLFAQQAAIAVDRARLWEAAQRDLVERQRAEQIQSALYRISEAAHTALNLDDLYRALHAIISDLMPARNFGLALYEPATDMFHFPYRVDENYPGEITPPPRHLSNTLVDFVWRTGVPLLATREQLDQVIARHQLKPIGQLAADWLGVPLKWQDKAIGVMVVQTYTPGERLTEEHKQILTFVSAQVAMVIQRKRAEEALHDSEQRYRDLFDGARRQAQELALIDRVRTALTRELDLDALFRTVVTAITDTFGYTLVSLYILEGNELVLQHQIGYDYVLERISIASGVTGRVVHTAQAVLLKDVRTDPTFLMAMDGIVSEVCVPITDQGRVVGVLNVESAHGVHLTEADLQLMAVLAEHVSIAFSQARLYTEAREYAARLTSAFESLPFDFWVTDRAGRYVMQNSHNVRKWGNRLGQHFMETNIDADTLRHWRVQHERVLTGETLNAETRDDGESGSHWYYEMAAPVRNDDRIVGVLGVSVDVTDRHRAEEALRDSEERYRLLFESNPHPMWACDTETLAFLEVNDAAMEHYGYSREEFLSMTIRDIRPPEDVPTLLSTIAGLADPLNRLGVWRHRKKDGTLIDVEITSHAVNLNGRSARIILANDVTERHQAEEALRRAQKMESLGLMAGGIAHDFNNLLVAMLGQTSLALGQLPTGSPARQPIEKAILAARRAADLTRQLLAYSGRGQFERRPIQLNQLIQENLHLFEVAVPKHVTLRSELAEPLPVIMGDAGQLQQVVMNLIINAAEALGERPGQVVVRTRPYLLTPDKAPLWQLDEANLSPAPYVLLEVEDNGLGMSQEILSKIFDPFFSTKFTGRGLGLAAVLGIVRGHEGGLRVTSELNVGTIFELVFPGEDVAAVEVPALEIVQGAPMHDQLVLVIDDEEPVRDAVTDILDLEGLAVLTAPDGQTGLELYASRQNDVALIMLDLSMPGLTGEETFRGLRQINPQAHILLSSGYSHDEVVSRFAGQRDVAFIQKPYDATQLLEEVRRQLTLGGTGR